MQMNVEIIAQKGDLLTVKLYDELDVESLEKNAYDGRFFAYLEPVLKDTTTDLQRKHYWALIGDISEYTGDPKWRIVLNMKYLYMLENEVTKEPSMARNKMKRSEAAKLIQLIIEWCIDNGVPFHHPTGYIPADESKYFFKMTMEKFCWICGKPNSQMAHYEAVGMGRNRNKIDHTNHNFMCLCQQHHSEQHNIGIETFIDKYKLPRGIKLNQEQLKELGL